MGGPEHQTELQNCVKLELYLVKAVTCHLPGES